MRRREQFDRHPAARWKRGWDSEGSRSARPPAFAARCSTRRAIASHWDSSPRRRASLIAARRNIVSVNSAITSQPTAMRMKSSSKVAVGYAIAGASGAEFSRKMQMFGGVAAVAGGARQPRASVQASLIALACRDIVWVGAGESAKSCGHRAGSLPGLNAGSCPHADARPGRPRRVGSAVPIWA
jgi:hypothetical protein